jgi:prepilin-type N-terminal cleavage/methylation domain-containing protein
MQRARAFTLIELLIVVAIIAILAAIAVPNFLEAQTRSKISRVQSDQRSLAVAIEAYHLDYNEYPAYGNDDDVIIISGHGSSIFLPTRLTTPLAYITALPFDIFPGEKSGIPLGKATTYFYLNNYACEYKGKTQHAGHVPEHYMSLKGEQRAVEWSIWSWGPDLDDDHGTVLYDPTNGTISSGDMMRFGP